MIPTSHGLLYIKKKRKVPLMLADGLGSSYICYYNQTSTDNMGGRNMLWH